MIALLEHINLAIKASGDPTTATARFYLGVLGCARDPRLEWMVHANIGLGQFHLLPGQPADQRINGEIALFYASLDALKERLVANDQAFHEHMGDDVVPAIAAYNFAQASQRYRHIAVSDPSGNLILCFESPHDYAATSTALGAHPGNAAVGDGLAYIKFLVRPGTAIALGAFYQQLLGSATVVLVKSAGSDLHMCSVDCGPLQRLLFEETHDVLLAYDGHHICIYVTEFEAAYHACAAKQLVWTNAIYEDKCDSWAETQKWRQFRILDVRDPTSNELLLQLEHEIRPLHHGRCPLASFQ
ncbi:hypothetical protein SPRG_11701 [Saprolegnia parasitica CBS 223.65]|uniref:VOC domain-containing protein n=1 Tax=Saprolegnia parasitica (strain CBS 223.65) TaxID=695850 RepID=A0A067C6S2_SAPPC|nr:hypothetical protein SPRG_11701 [Saprolegnia parasitica CBS 223.65]KDO22517.1 hypothetical protein SPRG_11701 [Saprolegnia parasitica CBS 223.65]|eukprot:XP_012206765.1 hypothetical protein SPRG_11701 [Saprolegnia parasitica CBS 223.65]